MADTVANGDAVTDSRQGAVAPDPQVEALAPLDEAAGSTGDESTEAADGGAEFRVVSYDGAGDHGYFGLLNPESESA